MEIAEDRQYYIDWVRVLAFYTLILFHCAMPFVIFGWEIKNAEHSLGLSRLLWWLHQWRLPLLFFISGAGIHFSLRRRSVLSFAGDRFVRLFIPLAFAMLFTIPFQVYFEWLQTGQYKGSYASFYPSVWKFIPYPEGSLTWSHMWYVVYLFVFCMILLPVFAIFRIPAVKSFRNKFSRFFSKPIPAFLLCIPLIFCFFTLYIKYPEQLNLINDWFVFTFSLILLLYGYLLGSAVSFWDNCMQYRRVYLLVAVVCIGVLYYAFWWKLEMPKTQNIHLYWYGTLNGMHIWSLILAVLGYAKKHLNFSNRFLKYNSQAVYPFYILHQTVIVIAGYYVVQWHLPMGVKFILLVIFCFLTILLLYQLIIRKFVLTRILYGLKPKEKSID